MSENTLRNLEVLLCLMTRPKIRKTNSNNTINNLRPMGSNSNTNSSNTLSHLLPMGSSSNTLSHLLPMGSNSNIARHLLPMGNSNLMLNSPMGSGSSRAMGQPCTDKRNYNMSVLDRVF